MRDLHAAARPARVYGRRPGATGTFVIFSDAEGAEHTRTWPNALPQHRSPCRIDTSKGLRQHRCSTAHADAVEGYRLWRETEEEAAEAATGGYETELAEYWSTRTRPTFKAYLQGMRRSEEASDAA